MTFLPQPANPHLSDLATAHVATGFHPTSDNAEASSFDRQPDAIPGQGSRRESEAERRDFVIKMKRAAEQILQARGGVPVPEGIVVAAVDPEGNLLWAKGAPFPERLDDENGF